MSHYRHNLNPIAFTLDGLPVSWYWLNYLASFFLMCIFLLYLQKNGSARLSRNQLLDHLLVSWFGVLVGARLGYVFIYNPSVFLESPSLIAQFWLGGMSFHGGLIGFVIANFTLARLKQSSFLAFTDLACLAMPLALFTGRIFNFVNGELWGRPSDLPWAVIFPTADELPRHPSQIYQALGEGVVLFYILWTANKRSLPLGLLSALFLLSYGAIRFFLEFFREPDSQLGYVLFFLSMGQTLSIVTCLAGILLYFHFSRKPW